MVVKVSSLCTTSEEDIPAFRVTQKPSHCTQTTNTIDNSVPLMEIAMLPIKGRSFIARHDIPRGTLLLSIPAYAYVVDSFHRTTLCSTCMDRSKETKLCDCDTLAYCSNQCKNIDLEAGHKFECRFFKEQNFTEWEKSFGEYPSEYTRLIVRILYRRWLEAQEFSQGHDEYNIRNKKHDNDNEHLPAGSPFGSGSQNFGRVCDLINNVSKFSDSKREEFELSAKFLDAFQSVLPTSPTLAPLSFQDLVDLVGKEECNSFGLYYFSEYGSRRLSYGLALFLEGVFFNHSCSPNVVHVTADSVQQQFFALRDIKQGEECTITYIPLQDDLIVRRESLKEYFQFWCDCSRCQAEERGEEDIMWRKGICGEAREKCQGWLIPKGEGLECQACGNRYQI